MDKEQALALLEQVVAEKGDGYIYEQKDYGGGDGPSCYYLEYADSEKENPVGPSCIVGHWAVAAGVELSEFLGEEATGARAVLPRLSLGLEEADPIVDALTQAQLFQDRGETWGDALIAAKEVLA